MTPTQAGLPSVGIFPASTDYSMPLVTLAKAAEDRGFTSLFLNEHTHLPVDHRRSPFPAGGPTPKRYAHFWDPFTALAFVAAQTSLTVGTAVSLVAEHDAIALAKAVATVDVLSGGRFVLGAGYGWNREEYEDHWPDARVRADVVLETIDCMRALWTDDEAEFHGTYRTVTCSWAWPKPVQQPSVPVLLGVRPGPEDRNFHRIARHADGWIPMGSAMDSPGFPDELLRLRVIWQKAGRSPDDLRITAIQLPVEIDQFRANRAAAGALGVERMLLYMADESEPDALAVLDRYAAALD